MYSRWRRGKRIYLPTQEMQEKWVQSLHQEDPLEERMATNSGILAWKIPWTEEFGRLQSRGSEESDMNEQLSTTQQRQIIEVETEVCTYAETQGENNVSHMHRTQENIMDSLVTRIVEHSWNSDSF